MIAEYFQRHAIEKPDEAFLVEDVATLSFRDAEQQARQMAAALHRDVGILPGSAVYLHARDSAQLVVALLATQYCGARVCVLDCSFCAEDLRRLTLRLPRGLLMTDAQFVSGWPGRVLRLAEVSGTAGVAPATTDAVAGGIVILTTGTTTGSPKAVFYVWERLLAQVRLTASPQRSRWALLYPLNHFAGLQVLLHAVKNGLSLAIPRTRQFSDVLECLIRWKVDSVSATPTFWRMFTGQLNPAGAAQLGLRQITLGGEPATADILDRLHELFPGARVTHVYATTEIGSCFAVSDGQPGFPSEFLDTPMGNVQLKIREGQLYVRTTSGMVDYVDGSPAPEKEGDWVATGDLVEVRGKRVQFLGRKGEVVNVGGVKVYPHVVEEPIRKVRGVRDVRVYGRANPVTGQIVAADLELSEGVAPDAVLAEVRQACRSALNRYEQPRELRVVAELRRSNGKLVRR
jgi:acyl-CoA synthetase (AMP-forming)/AMP-acid ligase II